LTGFRVSHVTRREEKGKKGGRHEGRRWYSVQDRSENIHSGMTHMSRIEVAVGIQSLGKGGDPSRELVGMNCKSTDLGTLLEIDKETLRE